MNIKFVYKGKKCGIVNGDEGTILCTDTKSISPDYKEILKLLAEVKEVKIDSKSIEEIFNEISECYIL
jgi:hypothetical protein